MPEMSMTISVEGSAAVVEIDNPPVNALSRQMRQGLLDAVLRLDEDVEIRAVVLLCAGKTFIAGADVNEFGKAPEPPHLPHVIGKIENSPKLWIAAMHGNVLGGGLEVALGCRYRIAAPKTNLGLPEVKLGIIPGAGGTVRLPRLVPLQVAVDLVTSGSLVGSEKAKSLGLIDEIVDGDLRKGAIAYANSIADRGHPAPLSTRTVPTADASYWERTEAAVASRAKREIAPIKALESVRNATERDFEGAMAFERETFLELRSSQQAAALRHIFFAERAATRPPEISGLPTQDIHAAAVVGGGTMGAGIVASLRDAGLPVVLIERDQVALQRGLQNIRSIYDASVKRGRITSEAAADRMSGVSASTDYAVLGQTDLVIEAVFEDLNVKRAVFAKLSEHCRSDAILATNTSYLDPNEISAGLIHPERFLGLHFFSPAHVMKLLEVVSTAATSPVTLATGFALARILGKIPVRAGVCDGFIGNRILKVTRAQAERLLLSGATPAAVDHAMRSFGMPMGPFEAQDLGGLDIAAFQRKSVRARGDMVFAPIADRLCSLGRFGQKSAGGWYDYSAGDRKPVHSEVVSDIVAEAASGMPQLKWDEKSIADAIILPMVSEGAAILDEKVALRPADIDLVEIHGYGFPRWRGGLMYYGEVLTPSAVLDHVVNLHAKGLAPEPSQGLIRAAASASFGSH